MNTDGTTTQGAAAKDAGTRQLPRSRSNPSQPQDLLTDERSEDWHPARISDRKLIELASRLDKVRRAGSAFADIDLSLEARERLKRIAPAELTDRLGV